MFDQSNLIPFAAGVGAVLFFKVFYSTAAGVLKIVKHSIQRRAAIPTRNAKRLAVEREVAAAEAWATSAADCPAPSADLSRRVVSASMSEIQIMLKERTVTCMMLLKIFVGTACEAHRKTNCLTNILLAEAIADAKLSDAKFGAPANSQIGPLEGMPISIKESLDVKGTDSACGLVNKCNNPALQDAALVTLLRAAGAIIFVKTNVPALLLSYECESNVHGTTTNPYSAKHTPGGSSGGEGALIALGGCAGGIGTDIGGSIRIPAHFCGIYGLKPSMSRVALRGSNPKGGQEGVAPVAGPMARSVSDLLAMFKALTPAVCPQGVSDGMLMHVPFQETEYAAAAGKKVLRVAYYFDDGFIPAAPACKRAVLEVVAALQKNGHQCTLFVPPCPTEIMASFFSLLSADGGKTLADNLSFDAANGVVGPLMKISKVPDFFKKTVLKKIVSAAIDPVFGEISAGMVTRTVDEYYKLLYARNSLRHTFAKSMQPFDFIVCPGFVVPAPKCGSTTLLSYSTNYTAMYNLLDLPCVVIPVTTVDPSRDAWDKADVQKAKNKGMTRNVAKLLYNAEEMKGLPVGVQLVTARMTEEATLAYAERVDAMMRK